MANEYDKIIKENLEALIWPLSRELFGFRIAKTEKIKEKLQVTLEREPDFVSIVETEKGDRFIFHLEFQSRDDAEMVFRMAEYKAILQRKFKLKVRQYVIYLGEKPSSMQRKLPIGWEFNDFSLIQLRELSFESLCQSETPEAVLMAIFSDFRGEKADMVIKKIIGKIQLLCPNEFELRRYIRQLNILSRLRKLENISTKISETMPISYDINEDKVYQRGLSKGREEGKIEAIKNLLNSEQFMKGILDYEKIAKILLSTEEEVRLIHQSME